MSQMTVKRDHFVLGDLRAVARQIARFDPKPVLEQVITALRQWPALAVDAGVDPQLIEAIQRPHCLFD